MYYFVASQGSLLKEHVTYNAECVVFVKIRKNKDLSQKGILAI